MFWILVKTKGGRRKFSTRTRFEPGQNQRIVSSTWSSSPDTAVLFTELHKQQTEADLKGCSGPHNPDATYEFEPADPDTKAYYITKPGAFGVTMFLRYYSNFDCPHWTEHEDHAQLYTEDLAVSMLDQVEETATMIEYTVPPESSDEDKSGILNKVSLRQFKCEPIQTYYIRKGEHLLLTHLIKTTRNGKCIYEPIWEPIAHKFLQTPLLLESKEDALALTKALQLKEGDSRLVVTFVEYNVNLPVASALGNITSKLLGSIKESLGVLQLGDLT